MSHCGNEENTTPTDPRIDFIAEYTLKSLRLKSDKWSRLIAPDEIKKFFNRFLEQDKPQVHKYKYLFLCENENMKKIINIKYSLAALPT